MPAGTKTDVRSRSFVARRGLCCKAIAREHQGSNENELFHVTCNSSRKRLHRANSASDRRWECTTLRNRGSGPPSRLARRTSSACRHATIDTRAILSNIQRRFRRFRVKDSLPRRPSLWPPRKGRPLKGAHGCAKAVAEGVARIPGSDCSSRCSWCHRWPPRKRRFRHRGCRPGTPIAGRTRWWRR